MFKRELYSTDFSENSKKATRCMKNTNPKEVTVLHVVDEEPFNIYEELPMWVDYDDEKAKKDMINYAKVKAKEIAREIGNAKVEVVVGEPWIEIVKRDEDYNIIVIGAFGRGEILVGSVAESVLRPSKCPVLVVR